MSRPIKFRVWHKEEKKFIDPYWIYIAAEGGGWAVLDLRDSWYEGNVTEEVELMQYTGLCDSDGTEIWEGDILYNPHNEEIGGVVFQEGSFYFVADTWMTEVSEIAFEYEVRGNIFENPELIVEGVESIDKDEYHPTSINEEV